MRFGLMSRIALALGGVGLIPLTLSSFSLLSIHRGAFEDQVLQTHSVAARTAAERVSTYTTALASLAESIAANPLVSTDPQSPVVRELLAATLQARPEVLSLSLLDAEGALVIGAQRRDLASEIAAAKCIAGENTPLRVLASASGQWLAFEQPLADAVGKVRLIAEAAALDQAVRSFEIGDQEADLLLVADNDTVLAGTVRSLTEIPAPMLESARSRRASGAGVFGADSAHPILGAWAPVEGAAWFVVSRQPVAVAQRVSLRMRRDSLAALGLAGLLVAVLSGAAHSTLVRPIRQLVEAQRRLMGRSPGTVSGNEIEQLRASFATLERRLRDHRDIGQIFLGRYQVLEVLGEGAMGSVFLGWDPKLERRVALKTVRIDAETAGLERKDLSAKLVKEAITAARFNHPNIVAVYDVEAAPDVAFIAMEYLDGTGLERVIWRRGALSEDNAVVLALAIARALDAAHKKGVVHRDIKPSNVLLGYDGSIKVVDFGIAELLSTVRRESEAFFGTPGYVPPEAIRGGQYGPAGDLFALGVVLYECLTGIPPFAGKNVRQTMVNTLDLEPEAVRRLRPELSIELEAIVAGLLHKDPNKRLSSAADLIARLEHLSLGKTAQWDLSLLPAPSERGDVETRGHSQLFPTLAGRSAGGAHATSKGEPS